MTDMILSFDSNEDKDTFIMAIRSTIFNPQSFNDLVQETIDKHVIVDPNKPIEETQYCQLLVSGQKMADGTYSQMMQRFKAEVGSHTATVEIRTKTIDGAKWKTVAKRTKQL